MFMFKLPNGKKINEEMVIEAMEDSNLSDSHFLNIKTGEVEKVSELFDDAVGKRYEELDNERYIKIPRISTNQYYEWMKEYTQEFIEREDPEFAKKVNDVLTGKNTFQKFKELLSSSEEGWIHGWDQWKSDCVYEEFTKWLAGLPIEITEEFEGFDDCPICQAMKEGVTSEKELKAAFRKARLKGAVVNILDEN